jgi:hypothetical protein
MGAHRSLIGLWVLLVIVVSLFASRCDHQNELDSHDGRVGFRFGMRGDTGGDEDFIAVTSDDGIIAAARGQLPLPISERTLHIHGPVTSGNGGYNLDWTWHFVPEDWVLVEESVEVCDVAPSAIGALLEGLPDTLSIIQACPLNSYVKSETRMSFTGQEP